MLKRDKLTFLALESNLRKGKILRNIIVDVLFVRGLSQQLNYFDSNLSFN
jgi:hypothetical protein